MVVVALGTNAFACSIYDAVHADAGFIIYAIAIYS